MPNKNHHATALNDGQRVACNYKGRRYGRGGLDMTACVKPSPGVSNNGLLSSDVTDWVLNPTDSQLPFQEENQPRQEAQQSRNSHRKPAGWLCFWCGGRQSRVKKEHKEKTLTGSNSRLD